MKFLIGCTALLLGIFPFWGCQEEVSQKEMIRPVRAIQIDDPSEFAKRWFPGQAKATQEVDLSFRVGGPMISRPVKNCREGSASVMYAGFRTREARKPEWSA